MWALVVKFFGTAITGILKINKVFSFIGKIKTLKKEVSEAVREGRDVKKEVDEAFASLQACVDKGPTQEELMSAIKEIFEAKKEIDEAYKEIQDVINLIREW